MSFSFEYHPTAILILPLFALAWHDCDDQACDATHNTVALGWLLWSIRFEWSNEC
jgi:hypothetical protein